MQRQSLRRREVHGRLWRKCFQPCRLPVWDSAAVEWSQAGFEAEERRRMVYSVEQ